MVSLKTKFEGSPLDWVARLNLGRGFLRLCQAGDIARYILTCDVTLLRNSQTKHRLVVCAIDMRWASHPLLGAVAYSHRLDRTTVTLEFLAAVQMYGLFTMNYVFNLL